METAERSLRETMERNRGDWTTKDNVKEEWRRRKERRMIDVQQRKRVKQRKRGNKADEDKEGGRKS